MHGAWRTTHAWAHHFTRHTTQYMLNRCAGGLRMGYQLPGGLALMHAAQLPDDPAPTHWGEPYRPAAHTGPEATHILDHQQSYLCCHMFDQQESRHGLSSHHQPHHQQPRGLQQDWQVALGRQMDWPLLSPLARGIWPKCNISRLAHSNLSMVQQFRFISWCGPRGPSSQSLPPAC